MHMMKFRVKYLNICMLWVYTRKFFSFCVFFFQLTFSMTTFNSFHIYHKDMLGVVVDNGHVCSACTNPTNTF